MERGEGYTIAHREELERTGNWTLVRRSLGCQSFGVNLVDIPHGESIPEHDETERDQEELFFVMSGSPHPGGRRRGAPRAVRYVRAR